MVMAGIRPCLGGSYLATITIDSNKRMFRGVSRNAVGVFRAPFPVLLPYSAPSIWIDECC